MDTEYILNQLIEFNEEDKLSEDEIIYLTELIETDLTDSDDGLEFLPESKEDIDIIIDIDSETSDYNSIECEEEDLYISFLFNDIINCPVCYEDIYNYYIFKCNHHLCFNCYEEWSERNDTCPMCRKQIF